MVDQRLLYAVFLIEGGDVGVGADQLGADKLFVFGVVKADGALSGAGAFLDPYRVGGVALGDRLDLLLFE